MQKLIIVNIHRSEFVNPKNPARVGVDQLTQIAGKEEIPYQQVSIFNVNNNFQFKIKEVSIET